MKKLAKYILISTLVLMANLSLPSCERDPVVIEEPVIIGNNDPDTDNKEASILTYMNGQVRLVLSAGSIKKSDILKVTQYLDNECMPMSDCNWIQNMIYIEPYMTFGAPVYVTIEYDRDRIDMELQLGGYIPVLYYWPNEEDLANLTRRETIIYDFDENFKSINFNIKKSGLYGIGLLIPDKS